MIESILGSRHRDPAKAVHVLNDDEVDRLLAEAENDEPDDEPDDEEAGDEKDGEEGGTGRRTTRSPMTPTLTPKIRLGKPRGPTGRRAHRDR
jgi:hypothetical protein